MGMNLLANRFKNAPIAPQHPCHVVPDDPAVVLHLARDQVVTIHLMLRHRREEVQDNIRRLRATVDRTDPVDHANLQRALDRLDFWRAEEARLDALDTALHTDCEYID